MRLGRYRGRHLKLRPRRRGRAVVGTAAAVWVTGSSAHASEYLVRPGETLSSIAARFGTSVAALTEANHLRDPNLIVAGTRLRVPARASVASVHVVRPGETLSSIAARYGSSVTALARANRLADPDLIVAGTRLRITNATAGRAEAPAPSGTSFDIGTEITEQAVAHGVDPALAKAVAWHESGWRQGAVSEAGAVGVMQVMPATARFVNDVLSNHRLRLRRAADNIHLGVMYLRHMLDSMPNERKALAAYYAGPGAVGGRLNAGQRHYVRSVQALKGRFR